MKNPEPTNDIETFVGKIERQRITTNQLIARNTVTGIADFTQLRRRFDTYGMDDFPRHGD